MVWRLELLVLVVGLSGCSGAPVTLQLGQLPAQGQGALIRGSGATSVAQVEGLRLWPRQLVLDGRSISEPTVVDFDGEPVELGTAGEPVAWSDRTRAEPGDYKTLSIEWDNAAELKASCQTGARLVYTTADGFASIPCTVEDCPVDMPDDFDYARLEFHDALRADGPSSTTDTVVDERDVAFTLGDGGRRWISVLVDVAFSTACYDGTLPLSEDGSGPVLQAPFTGEVQNGSLENYYRNGVPSFGGVHRTPVVWVARDDALPAVESYLVAESADDLSAEGVVFARTQLASLAFDADGALVDGAVHTLGQAQLLGTYVKPAPAGSTMDVDTADVLGDSARKAVGMTRPGVDEAPVRTEIEEGPGCGILGTESCGGPMTAYWVRVPR